MNKEQAMKVLECVILLFDNLTISQIIEKTGIDKKYCLIAGEVYRTLRFYPENQVKGGNVKC